MPPPRSTHREGDMPPPSGGVAIARPRRSALDVTSFLKSFYESRATSLPSGVGCCESFLDPTADHYLLGSIAAGGERGPRPHRAGSALRGGADNRSCGLAPMRLASRATSLSVNADQSYPPPLLGPAVSFPYRNAYRCYEPTAVVACGERGLPLSRSEAGPTALSDVSNGTLPPAERAAANATKERARQRANSLMASATEEEAAPAPAVGATKEEPAPPLAIPFPTLREETVVPLAIPFPAPPPLQSPLHRVRRGASGRLLLLASPGAAPLPAVVARPERRDAEVTCRDAGAVGSRRVASARDEAPSVAAVAAAAAVEDSFSEITSCCDSSLNADHEINRNTTSSFYKSKTAGEGGPRAGAAAAEIMAARVLASAATKRRQGEEEPTAVERIVAEMQAAAAEEERVAASAKAAHARLHEVKEESPRAIGRTEAQDVDVTPVVNLREQGQPDQAHLAVVMLDNLGEQCPLEQGPPRASTENSRDQEPRSNMPRADPPEEGAWATTQNAGMREIALPCEEPPDASPVGRPPAHCVPAAPLHIEGPSKSTDGPCAAWDGAATPAVTPLPASLHRVRRGADGRLHFVALHITVRVAAPSPLASSTAPDTAAAIRVERRYLDSASSEEPAVVADSVDVAANYSSSAGTDALPCLLGTTQTASLRRPNVTPGAVASSRVAPEQRQLGRSSSGLTGNCIGGPYSVCTVSGQRQLRPIYSWDVANDRVGRLYADGAPCVVAE